MTKSGRIKSLRSHRERSMAAARHMRRYFPEMTAAIAACISNAVLNHRALMAEINA